MFEIYQSEKTQKFHFRLKAKNGEIILTGQAIKDSTNGKQYFVLKSGNGQIIGQSQMYKTASGLKNGIASVGKNSVADVKDLT